MDERPSRTERRLEGRELGAIGWDQAVDATRDQVRVLSQRRVDAHEAHTLLLELRVEMGDGRLGVVLDQQAAAVPDLAGGLQDPPVDVVEGRRGLPGSEWGKRAEVEPGEVRIPPLLRLLRRHRERLERLQSPQ